MRERKGDTNRVGEQPRATGELVLQDVERGGKHAAGPAVVAGARDGLVAAVQQHALERDRPTRDLA